MINKTPKSRNENIEVILLISVRYIILDLQVLILLLLVMFHISNEMTVENFMENYVNFQANYIDFCCIAKLCTLSYPGLRLVWFPFACQQ